MKTGPTHELVARCEDLVKQCTKVVDPIELGDGGCDQKHIRTYVREFQHDLCSVVTVETEIIRVPDNKVGLIIGRGGSTIRSLMQESGATIDIPKGPLTQYRHESTSYSCTENLTGDPYREIKA